MSIQIRAVDTPHKVHEMKDTVRLINVKLKDASKQNLDQIRMQCAQLATKSTLLQLTMTWQHVWVFHSNCMLAGDCDSHMGLVAHLIVILEPSWEYSVFAEADILVLLHHLVHAVHAQVLQVHPCCQALQPHPNQSTQNTSTMTCTDSLPDSTPHDIGTWQPVC